MQTITWLDDHIFSVDFLHRYGTNQTEFFQGGLIYHMECPSGRFDVLGYVTHTGLYKTFFKYSTFSSRNITRLTPKRRSLYYIEHSHKISVHLA